MIYQGQIQYSVNILEQFFIKVVIFVKNGAYIFIYTYLRLFAC